LYFACHHHQLERRTHITLLALQKETVEVTKLSKKAYGARKDTTYCYEKNGNVTVLKRQ
jgi:hypothetical protein